MVASTHFFLALVVEHLQLSDVRPPPLQLRPGVHRQRRARPTTRTALPRACTVRNETTHLISVPSAKPPVFAMLNSLVARTRTVSRCHVHKTARVDSVKTRSVRRASAAPRCPRAAAREPVSVRGASVSNTANTGGFADSTCMCNPRPAPAAAVRRAGTAPRTEQRESERERERERARGKHREKKRVGCVSVGCVRHALFPEHLQLPDVRPPPLQLPTAKRILV